MTHGGVLDRVRVAARVVVGRARLTARELGEVLERGTLEESGEGVCELEAGGVCVARGRIVRRGGRYWFRVIELGREETR